MCIRDRPIRWITLTRKYGVHRSRQRLPVIVWLYCELLQHYHKLFDIYNNYDGINNIKTINDNAGIKPVTVDREILNLLDFSVNVYELTDGKVNVAMGSVLEVWHDYRTAGMQKSEAQAFIDRR